MRLVVNTPDLPTLQQHAMDLGRERNFKARITRMRRSKAWGDLGDLKRELLDLWTEERNTLAKQVMQDIEAQRKGAGREGVTGDNAAGSTAGLEVPLAPQVHGVLLQGRQIGRVHHQAHLAGQIYRPVEADRVTRNAVSGRRTTSWR